MEKELKETSFSQLEGVCSSYLASQQPSMGVLSLAKLSVKFQFELPGGVVKKDVDFLGEEFLSEILFC